MSYHKDDFFEDLVAYDIFIGLDETRCPNCGESISSSLIMGNNEIECPKCGKKFTK